MKKTKKKISKMLKPTKKKEKSFTLLELLIVIAVIAILAAIVVASLSGARQSAWEARGLQFSQNIKSTLATDLVGEWSFDDPNNPGRDDSGNIDISDVVVNGTTYEPKGQIRGARFFNGSSDYIRIPQPSIGLSPNFFTVEGFIKPDYQNCFFITPQSTGLDQYLRYDPTNQRIIVHVAQSGDTNERDVPSKNGSVPLNKWSHFAVSINNLNIKIYINGNLDNDWSTEIPIANWSNYWMIGQRGNSTYYLRGYLDEVRIYNRALTAYEIKALYAEGKMRHLADR